MVPGAGEHVVGRELEIEVLPTQQAVHEHDELEDELVLSEVVPQLEHHLGRGEGEGRGRGRGRGRGGEGRDNTIQFYQVHTHTLHTQYI